MPTMLSVIDALATASTEHKVALTAVKTAAERIQDATTKCTMMENEIETSQNDIDTCKKDIKDVKTMLTALGEEFNLDSFLPTREPINSNTHLPNAMKQAIAPPPKGHQNDGEDSSPRLSMR